MEEAVTQFSTSTADSEAKAIVVLGQGGQPHKNTAGASSSIPPAKSLEGGPSPPRKKKIRPMVPDDLYFEPQPEVKPRPKPKRVAELAEPRSSHVSAPASLPIETQTIYSNALEPKSTVKIFDKQRRSHFSSQNNAARSPATQPVQPVMEDPTVHIMQLSNAVDHSSERIEEPLVPSPRQGASARRIDARQASPSNVHAANDDQNGFDMEDLLASLLDNGLSNPAEGRNQEDGAADLKADSAVQLKALNTGNRDISNMTDMTELVDELKQSKSSPKTNMSPQQLAESPKSRLGLVEAAKVLGPPPGYSTQANNLSGSPTAGSPIMSPRADMSESWKKDKELRKSPLATGTTGAHSSRYPNSRLRLQPHGSQEVIEKNSANPGKGLLMSALVSTGLAPQRSGVKEDQSSQSSPLPPPPPPPRSEQGGREVKEVSPQKSGLSGKDLKRVAEEGPIVRPRPPQVHLLAL